MTRAMTAVILVAIAMAGLVLVRRSGSDAGDGAPMQLSLWSRMQAAAGDVPVQEARSVLRRNVRAAREAPGRMPVALQAKVRASLSVPAGVPFENTHRLDTPRGALWLTDLRRATCIVQASDGALACDTTAHVAQRGVVLSVYAVTDNRPHDFVLFGLAPDGIRHAQVRTAGRVRAVAVRDNVYSAAAPGPITLAGLLR